MKKLYYTNRARESAINEIDAQINRLGGVKSGDLPYCDYRGIVRNLSLLKEAIMEEMKEAQK